MSWAWASALLALVVAGGGGPPGARGRRRRRPVAAPPASRGRVTGGGSVEARAWPARHGAAQFLASWLGPAIGPRSRSLHLELWRQRAGGGAVRVWSSGDAFPEGLPATEFAANEGRIL